MLGGSRRCGREGVRGSEKASHGCESEGTHEGLRGGSWMQCESYSVLEYPALLFSSSPSGPLVVDQRPCFRNDPSTRDARSFDVIEFFPSIHAPASLDNLQTPTSLDPLQRGSRVQAQTCGVLR
jgi:hypothetical protein